VLFGGALFSLSYLLVSFGGADIASYIVYVVFVGVLILACAIMITYDLIANRNSLLNVRECGGLFSFWWQDDAYLFRLEGVLIAITVSFIIIYEQILTWSQDANVVIRLIYPWSSVIIYFTILFMILFSFDGFIVIAAAIQDFIDSNREIVIPNVMRKSYMEANQSNIRINNNYLDWILDEKAILPLFQEFAKSEYSLENVLVCLEIREFRKISRSSARKKKKKASKIVNTFVRLGTVDLTLI
jgi:hypothetical protein